MRATCGVSDYTHTKNTVMRMFGNPCGSDENSK